MVLIKRFFILTPILIFLDQIVKILVYIFFYEPHVHIDFIDGFLALCPFLNTQSVFLASLAGLLNFDISNRVLYSIIMIISAIFFLGIIMLISLYFSFVSKERPNKKTYYLFSFTVAGAVCSTVDTLFWGGSLDFIMLFDWVIFDMKDIYIWTFIVFMILCTVQAVQNFMNFSKEERKNIPGFLKWIKMKCPTTPQSAV